MSIASPAGIAMAVLALTTAVRPSDVRQASTGAVHVPRAVLERYVREYVYPAGNAVVVRLRGDTLARQIPPGPDLLPTPIEAFRPRGHRHHDVPVTLVTMEMH